MSTSTRATLFTCCLVAASALASVPSTLAYSGRVLRPNGTPETGVTQLRFSLFSVATGGTALWSETQTLALNADGLYQTKLGAVTSLEAVVTANDRLFLEVQVGQVAPLSPRQELSSVATALVAKSVQGGEVDASSLKVNGVAVVPGFSTVRGLSASGTVTLPAGVTRVYVKAWGAGGAGGTTWQANGTITPGGGGGAGGYAEDVLTVPAGATLTVTVGAAGRSVINCSATSGGDSSVRVGGMTVVEARGGGAGGHASNCCPGQATTAGAGGQATGSVAVPGESGLSGSNGGDGGKNAMSPVFGRGASAVLRSSTCSLGDSGGAGFVWLAW
ncbi:MAG: hypothetical protein MUC96_28580 [Myxococcaceae bacterium]|jgi:hypothetical protein|nr:hypothetical protein [Myxococcaceae bacterium]